MRIRLFPLIAILFLTVPLIEIYLLIKIGGVIGVLPTIALVVATALLGTALLRKEGLATLAKVRVTLDSGELPAFALLEGLSLLTGGVLLLTPGFITDLMEFICLLPPTRRLLVKFLMARGKFIPTVNTARDRAGQAREGQTLEGEFTEKRDH